MSNAQKLSQAVAGGIAAVRTAIANSWTAAQTFDSSIWREVEELE